MNKLKSAAGETIAEALAAALVIALSFLLLASAVVTASRINETHQAEEISFRLGSSGNARKDGAAYNVTIAPSPETPDIASAQIAIDVYYTETPDGESGYYFYEKQQEAEPSGGE